MKLLFNQHLSPSLCRYFSQSYPGSVHVSNVGLDSSDDIVIWEYARNYDFIIVTKDSDYHDLGMRYGFPPYVLLIKRGNCPTEVIKEIINNNSDNIKRFIDLDKSGILILF
jgi:predicted nuclease of predicted toxin-antitoxin system